MPRKKIDGSLREKYGLPPNSLGKHWNKDAVSFYNVFCTKQWSSSPDEFQITRKEFLAFGVARKRVCSIPREAKDEYLQAMRLKQSSECTILRLGINKAALNKTLQSVLEWPFQIVKHIVGSTYSVQSAETRVANGIDAEAVIGFANAKKTHIQSCYSAIKPEKHSAQEMQDLYAKSEFDDQLFDDFDRAVEDMKQRIEASSAVRRLETWALQEKEGE